jgi:hypothetical protein
MAALRKSFYHISHRNGVGWIETETGFADSGRCPNRVDAVEKSLRKRTVELEFETIESRRADF